MITIVITSLLMPLHAFFSPLLIIIVINTPHITDYYFFFFFLHIAIIVVIDIDTIAITAIIIADFLRSLLSLADWIDCR